MLEKIIDKIKAKKLRFREIFSKDELALLVSMKEELYKVDRLTKNRLLIYFLFDKYPCCLIEFLKNFNNSYRCICIMPEDEKLRKENLFRKMEKFEVNGKYKIISTRDYNGNYERVGGYTYLFRKKEDMIAVITPFKFEEKDVVFISQYINFLNY